MNNSQTTEFLNALVDSVKHTFKVQLQTTIAAGKVASRKPGEKGPKADVAGIVGLLSTHFTGSLTIAFPEPVYLKVMSRMLNTEYTTMHPDIEDGAAEIVNMVLGQCKRALNEKGFGIKLAIPTVVRGKDLVFQPNIKSPSILIPYIGDMGDFYVEVATSQGN